MLQRYAYARYITNLNYINSIILIWLDIIRTRKYSAERIVMVRFLNCSRGTDDHTVITLVVFQVVMVFTVSQGDITLFRQQ